MCRRGRLDTATRDRVSGWAIDTDGPVQAAAVQVLANGALIARVLANTYRATANLAADRLAGCD